MEQFRYDPWGLALLEEDAVLDSLIALSPWQCAGKSIYVGGHGYTGHEHLPGFGLLNCNARLYDPALGRFLMPDPLIQDPESTQNFNRYTYCLNNPLKYTDESGEYALVDDLIAGLIGGVVNWAGNGCYFTWEGLSYFGVGFAGGTASLYISPVASSALVAAANSVIGQGFSSDSNKWNGSKINYGRALFDGVVGGVTSIIGGSINSMVSSWIGNLTDLIPGKAIAQMLNRGLSNGLVALGANAISAYNQSKNSDLSYGEAFKSGIGNVWQAMAFGAIAGVGEGIQQARELGENPWALRTQTKANHYSVYQGINKETGEVKYIGMTGRDPEVRWGEHKRSGTPKAKLEYNIVKGGRGLSRQQARILEQQLINQNGLPNLYNRINSISPRYWELLGIKP